MMRNAPIRDETGLAAENTGYYGVPVIHGSHWKWLVIWYFFFGGISGASAVIAGIARLTSGRQGAALARVATYVSFAALIPCPPLLILDLGRPARFLNMVRTLRPSSPMSIGSWGLSMYGAISVLVTLQQLMVDLTSRSGSTPPRLLRASGNALAVPSAITGFFVAGYTGTLLAATAVPLWSKQPAILGPLFLSSAMTSGSAAITAATFAASVDDESRDGLHRLEAISTIAECLLLAAWIVRLGDTGKPMTEGRIGSIVRNGAVGLGMVTSLAASAVSYRAPGRLRVPLRLAAAAVALTGVFCLRYAVVEGGRRSADDPRATFEMTG